MRTIVVGDYKIELAHDGVLPAALPDLSGSGWRDVPAECATNGVDSIYAWDLDDGLRLYVDCLQGGPVCAYAGDDDLTAHLTEWYGNSGAECELAEWLAAWGQDGLAALAVADEEYTGPCRVWRAPNYYAGTCNVPLAGFARDDDRDDILEFGSREEAEAYVEEYYEAPSQYEGIPACNVLAHGQAGSDTLTIVQHGEMAGRG